LEGENPDSKPGCANRPNWPKWPSLEESVMKSLSAADAKNSFGHLIDLARHEPVMIEKHNRPVVVVISVEEYNRLLGEACAQPSADNTEAEPSSVA
jgi:prevent-host-death family protein